MLEDVLIFLCHWLAYHILQSDKQIGLVALSVQSGMSIAQAKDKAKYELSGSTEALIDTVLAMYDTVAKHTLQLMKTEQKANTLLKRNDLLMQSTHEGIHVLNRHGKVIECNEAFCRHLGYSREDLLNLSLYDFEAKLTPEQIRAGLEEALDSQAQMETVHRRKDGVLIDVEIVSSGVELDGEKCLFALSRDITERKRYESLMQFRLKLIEMASVVDHEYLMQKTLDKAEELTGSSIGFFHYVEEDQETISLQTWSTNTLENMCKAEGAGQHYPVSQAGVWANAIRTRATVIENDYPHSEHKMGMPEGHSVVDRFVSVPIMRNNNIVAMIGVGNKPSDYISADTEIVFQLADFVFDLIQTKKIQEMLRASESRMRVMLENELVGIVTVKDRIFQWANPAYEKTLGYERGELIGKPVKLIFLNDDAYKTFGDTAYPLINAGKVYRTELVYLCKDGSHKTVEVSGGILNEEYGESLWTCVDITQRKLAEQDLQNSAKLFRKMADSSPLAILMTSGRKQKTEYINPTFIKIFGYTLNDIPTITEWWLKAYPDEHYLMQISEEWQRLSSLALETNSEIQPIEVVVTSMDGSKNHILWSFVSSGDKHWAFGINLTESKHREDELREIAFHDSLTKLPNRRLLLDRLQQAIRSSKRQGSHGAVLFLDLDKFKLLNDTHGHDIGDQLLIQVATRLLKEVRVSDTVARLGGDEFVILLEGLDSKSGIAAEQASFIVNKIRATLSDVYLLGGVTHHFSASIGIKLFIGDELDPDEIIKEADVAMYETKKKRA